MFFTILKQPTPCGRVAAGSTIINTGAVPVYLGDDPNTAQNAPAVGEVIYPGGQLVWDHDSKTLWAIDKVGLNPTIEITRNSSGQNSGYNVALFDNPLPILDSGPGGYSIPASGTQILGSSFIPVSTWQSWSLSFNFAAPYGTTPYAQITFLWSNSPQASTYAYQEDWIVPITGIGGSFIFVGHGPHYGPYLTVQISNFDSVACKPIWQLYGSNRPIQESTIRTNYAVAPSPGGFGTDDVLYWEVGTQAANTSSTPQTMGYYNGPVTVRLQVSGTSIVASTGVLHIDFQPKTLHFNGVSSYLINGPEVANGAASADVIKTINLPRRPATIFFGNTSSTVSMNYRILITAKGATL